MGAILDIKLPAYVTIHPPQYGKGHSLHSDVKHEVNRKLKIVFSSGVGRV